MKLSGNHSAMGRKRRLIGLIAPVLVGGVAVWQLVAPALRPNVPSAAQWAEVSRAIAERFKKGDVIRVEPGWMTAGRVYLGDLDNGPRKPFRILDIHDPVDKAWLYHFSRLWLITTVEERGKYAGIVPPGAELVDTLEFASATVFLFELPSGMIHWDMLAALPHALVERRDGVGNPIVCPWQAARHKCNQGAHLDVKQELRRVAGSARQCVLVRPGPDGRPATLTFNLPKQEGTLLVRVGNTVEAARSKHGGTVNVTVLLDDKVVEELAIERRDYSLHEVRAETRGGGKLVVTLVSEDDRKREICLDGYLLDTRVQE